MQCDAMWCSVLLCVAVCCSVLQCVAVCCSGSSANNTLPTLLPRVLLLQCVASVDIDIYIRKDRDQKDYLKFVIHTYVTYHTL